MRSWWLLSCALLGCRSESPVVVDDAGASDASDAAVPTYRFTVVGTDVIKLDDGRTWTAERIVAERPDGRRTLLAFAPQAARGSVVVTTQPYVAVPWGVEEVDGRFFAAKPDPKTGLVPDTECPEPDRAGGIVVNQIPADTLAQMMAIDLLNGHAALTVYGRFYTCGTPEDDIADVVAGFELLRTRATQVDPARIGVFGASWGGFMALHGSARVAPALRPSVVAALYPPTDLLDMVDHARNRLPKVYPRPADLSFFAPYLRRIERAPVPEPSVLCAALPRDVLVAHDDWDVLVPATESAAFLGRCPTLTLVPWARTTPADYGVLGLSHGPIADDKDGTVPFSRTIAQLHVHTALATADAKTIVEAYSESSLVPFVASLRAAKAAGRDVSAALVPLRELVDPRVLLMELPSKAFASGAAALAKAVNGVYGTTYDEASLRAVLAKGLP